MIPLLVLGIIAIVIGVYIRQTSVEGPGDSKARISRIVGICLIVASVIAGS